MNKKIKILLVFGTRPEAIKMAPVYIALMEASEYFRVEVCVTAQHRHLLDQVLKVFDIHPDYDLNIMREGQDLSDITSNVILGLKEVLKKSVPKLLLVHGDTTTAMAAALAASYAGISVGHIEAGLRTYNISSPFPEEMNRQIITRLASVHFCPTELSRKNLISEGIDHNKIYVTGNTAIDALHWNLKRLHQDQNLHNKITENISSLIKFDWMNAKFVLVTGHRRENFGNGLREICLAIKAIASKYPNIFFIYPVHPNPNVKNAVSKFVGEIRNVYLIDPLDYETFILLLSRCYLVLTDSGGIQEEAPSLSKPVLVMRECTERPEGVDAGVLRLVGTNTENIISNVCKLLDDEVEYQRMSKSSNPYGDGNACQKIIKVLLNN